MKSREIEKSRHLCDIIVEKSLELAEYLLYAFRRKREWTSHLTEEYCIYDNYADKEFVKDFLAARRKALELNRYKMEIKTIPHHDESDTIGYVRLLRNKKLISRATLKIKESDRDDNKPIYWSFDKNCNTK